MKQHLRHAKSIARRYHEKIPVLRALPIRVLVVIAAVAIVNMLCWAGVGVALSKHRALTGTSVLAYTLGLRHALDADHIAAIDLTTRKLIASGQRPVTVGMFFSLGHSTIVIVTSITVAGTAAGVSARFGDFARVGGIVGTSVSAAFLIILGVMNIYILYKLVKQLKMLMRSNQEGVLFGEGIVGDWSMSGGGCLTTMFRGLFGFIDRPWKMYPLGVALLGIASIEATKGTSIWLILIFPVLFTAGMCLIDTTDGALMSALYSTSSFAHDDIAIVYYSIALTLLTVLVAVVIGVIQILSLIQHVLEPTGRFWDGVEKVGERYDVLGGCIAGMFVATGVAAWLAYKPVRRVIDKKRAMISRERGEEEEGGGSEDGVGIVEGGSSNKSTTKTDPLKGSGSAGGNGTGVIVKQYEAKAGSSTV
ncbi:NicO-domain-containing protein [Choiromyces venosus 120613-1]|uniref:Nickel/cobalt efflux system n=1 Tax=Choiromyces venosus 120613-1 TaxID=1336337 RepID=A0A3N4JCL3_9PEZI|nr:NicO-domain-containing protein [Choiromyces venosus 120613-1]